MSMKPQVFLAGVPELVLAELVLAGVPELIFLHAVCCLWLEKPICNFPKPSAVLQSRLKIFCKTLSGTSFLLIYLYVFKLLHTGSPTLFFSLCKAPKFPLNGGACDPSPFCRLAEMSDIGCFLSSSVL